MRPRKIIPLPRLTLSRLLFLSAVLIFSYLLFSFSAMSGGGDQASPVREKRQGKRFADYQVRSDKVDPSSPGENGVGVVLKGEEQELSEKLFKKEAFNIIASDKISLQRSVPDVRDPR